MMGYGIDWRPDFKDDTDFDDEGSFDVGLYDLAEAISSAGMEVIDAVEQFLEALELGSRDEEAVRIALHTLSWLEERIGDSMAGISDFDNEP